LNREDAMLKNGACILSILAGLACQPALAVTYYFSGSAPDFSGTFSFDPATSAITDASLNTPGVTFITPGGTLAPIDNWVQTNFTTWSGGTTFNGGPIVSTGVICGLLANRRWFPRPWTEIFLVSSSSVPPTFRRPWR
jgi:hypothetical protein